MTRFIKHQFVVGFLFLTAFNSQAQTTATPEAGMKLYNGHEYTAAADVFSKLIQQEPDNGIYNYYQGLCELAKGKKEIAKTLFEGGLSKTKCAGFCQIGLEAILMADSNIMGGTQAIVKVIEPTKMKDAPLLLAAAKALITYKGRNTDQALVYMNKLKDSDKSNPEVFITFGDLYMANGDGSNAIKQYETAQSLKPGNARIVNAIGNLWARAMNYSLATDNFKLAISFDSTYGPAYKELAEMFYYAKKYELAKTNMAKYASICDEDQDDMLRYANYAYLSKDYATTLGQIDFIQNQRTDVPTYLFRLKGAALYETGKYAEGIEAMNMFFTKHDSSKIIADDYKYYGRLLGKTRQDSMAIIYLQKAFATDTSQYDLLSEIGNSYLQLKKYDDAIAVYKAKVIVKSSTNDYFQLGRAYYFSAKSDTVRINNSIEAFKKVVELQPSFSNGWLYLARAQAALDKDLKGLAKPAYEKYLELTGGDVTRYKKEMIEANTYFASFHYFNNQKNESIPYWKKVLELDPKNVEALKAQKVLKF